MRLCETCQCPLVKPRSASGRQWLAKRFCSNTCKVRAPKVPLTERFWAKVGNGGVHACWPWTGSLDGHGYGTIAPFPKGAPLKAHRVSWEIENGKISSGQVVRHKCDNPRCVNPSHLELGTHRDNVLDRVKRGRTNPNSLLNLRPGAPGFHGAGPRSRREARHG